MNLKMKRRDFLKVMGWSGIGVAVAACDRPSYITHREGRNHVVSYVMPEEYAIPGIGVSFASTCGQCPAVACGTHARVREGRVLKLEGNPESPLNQGKLCAMGQAGLQTHYNPDRITRPRRRQGSGFVDISWDEAMQLLEERIGPNSGIDGERVAWLTGTISGHQAVVLDALRENLGASSHYVHEAVNDAVWRAVCRDMLGEESPRLAIDRARVIFSLGADFLGTWGAPVPNARQYAAFRDSPRGVLLAAESKMSTTGANADLWVPVRPGTEGALALGIANLLVTSHGRDIDDLPDGVQAQIRSHDAERVSELTGTSVEHMRRIAALLHERSPSLVLAGAPAGWHERGYDNVAAAMTLNLILGNVGRTIESAAGFPFEQLRARPGNGRALHDLADAMKAGRYDVLFLQNTNPVFAAPPGLGFREALEKVPFKVSLTMFEDETSQLADLVLPMRSHLEDWGTHVPQTQQDRMVIAIQQPVMTPLYPETRGFGDLMIDLLRMRGDADYAAYEDYYAYLHHAFVALPASLKDGAPTDALFWNRLLQKGQLDLGVVTPTRLAARAVDFEVAAGEPASDELFVLPSASPNFWDGRHANVPWLQELPDSITKAVWDSWAEIHPSTARRLGGVETGDVLSVQSDDGTIGEVRAYVYKGMHPDAIAIPVGQGHETYGRYARGRGVNPFAILTAQQDHRTGEPAAGATRARVTLVRKAKRGHHTGSGTDRLVVLGGSETQLGRRLVVTVTADQFDRTEGRRA